MLSLLSCLMLVVATLLTVAAFVMFAEVMAATLSARSAFFLHDLKRPPVVVLVPAHNESRGILPTLADVKSQLRATDRLFVVADNCTDDTAELAQAAGAKVVVRRDPEKLGKGYAIDFGLRALQQDDPQIVIMIDADCRLGKGALDQLALTCGATGRPVQALYLMSAPQEATPGHLIAEFAWRVKNDVRPYGLWALGLPCQLMGTGMSFPRKAIESANLASGHLAEDLDLGFQLARAGHLPLLCPQAVVRSEFPASAQAAAVQRRRWEHGHLAVIATRVFPMVWIAVRHGSRQMLALALDAAVPPLVLLGLLILATLVASAVVSLSGGGVAPLIACSAALLFFSGGLAAAWMKSGRDLLTLRVLIALIPYIASKFAIYATAFASNKKWERTGREKPR